MVQSIQPKGREFESTYVYVLRILINTLATVITNGLKLFDADLNIDIGNSNYKWTQAF